MTDTEKIIKGIKICGDDKSSCKDCPYYELKSPMCLDTLHEEATDLIRRQQEEINHSIEADKMVAETDKTEDEILKKLLTKRVEFIPNSQDVEDIKREAIREFAEKLKEQSFECDISFGLGSQRVKEAVAVDDIDNLVKEFAKDINVRANPEQPKEAEKKTATAEHRVGDRVRVRYDLSVGDYGNAFCNANMVSQAGKILTIAKEPDSFGRYKVKECGYIWNDLMFEDEFYGNSE